MHTHVHTHTHTHTHVILHYSLLHITLALHINMTDKLTNDVTPWSTVLHEKPEAPQLINKFPVFYRISRFITALRKS